MLHFTDSKMMAKALRKALAERRIEITHADSLEFVARQFGFANWNMLSARIDAEQSPSVLPEGWKISGGGRPDVYRIGIDPAEPGAVRIATVSRSDVVDADHLGSLMQSILADEFRGQTLRISAELKGRGVERGVLWMRVDPANGRSLRFDNMLSRATNGPIRGDVAWTERSIVLDVPTDAATIHYGIMLGGGGELWARNFRLEAVDPASVATTGSPYPSRPANLGFGAPA